MEICDHCRSKEELFVISGHTGPNAIAITSLCFNCVLIFRSKIIPIEVRPLTLRRIIFNLSVTIKYFFRPYFLPITQFLSSLPYVTETGRFIAVAKKYKKLKENT